MELYSLFRFLSIILLVKENERVSKTYSEVGSTEHAVSEVYLGRSCEGEGGKLLFMLATAWELGLRMGE